MSEYLQKFFSLKIFYSFSLKEVVGVVGALWSLVVAGVQIAEIKCGEVSLGDSDHLVVKLIRDDCFTGQKPEERLGEATGVNN